VGNLDISRSKRNETGALAGAKPVAKNTEPAGLNTPHHLEKNGGNNDLKRELYTPLLP
jgi:hypothetical protein